MGSPPRPSATGLINRLSGWGESPCERDRVCGPGERISRERIKKTGPIFGPVFLTELLRESLLLYVNEEVAGRRSVARPLTPPPHRLIAPFAQSHILA